MPAAAYVHIPFCRRRCYYCDFPISVVGDRPPLSRLDNQSPREFGTIAEYVEALCQEILTFPAFAQPLDTVFLGGGTPSLLTVEQLTRILQTLDTHIGIAANAEISIEMDPGTFDLAVLQGYRAAGINRVSLGVQAFQPKLLAACGRSHTPADIAAAVEMIRQVNLANFSLDLISGLPHQTLDHWQESLEAAIALHPTHLSVYDLTVEAGTAFDRWYQPGTNPLPSDATTADMYRLAQKALTQAGYEHYEISNYARSGYQCRHNRVYWENRSYYGFGMGATSYVNGQRFSRPRKRHDYYQWVQQLQEQQGLIDQPPASPEDQLLDTLMLGLRLADGLKLEAIASQFTEAILPDMLQCLQPYIQKGWVQLLTENNQPFTWQDGAALPANSFLRLSDPEGFLFSNVILATLFEKLSA
ncbi:MAG: radical SAM family heme chaperone HemW [Elainellaceae cyanobacterium]